MGQSQIGLLGSLVYAGNAIGSIIMTPIFIQFNPKYVVSFSVLCNIGTLVLFTLYNNFALMAIARIFAGIF